MNKLEEALRSIVQKQDEYIIQLETHCQNLRSQCDYQQQLLIEFKSAIDDMMHLLEKKWLKDSENRI